jgi:glycosyltransferase involved in cell wall biosynthesis
LRRKVVNTWEVSSFFGWGVYGLNLALAWADDPEVELVCARPVRRQNVALDAIRLGKLARFFQQSHQLQAQLQEMKDGSVTVQTPVLVPLGADFGLPRVADNLALTGVPTVGVTFFETARLTPAAVEAASRYPLIVTGSSWNEQVLRAHGLTNVRTVLQGVDPLLFHPGAPVPRDDGRFLVFSGGKLELRKGQDIVLAAFRKFAARHPDAVLVGAWHSPWPHLARSVDKTGLATPVVFDANSRLDSSAWAVANGLRPEQFIDAGQTANGLMPQLLRQVDVALFANRCEGGTNLVAMECMASGVPTILSANSGHLDLIEEDNCFVLSRQGEVGHEPGAAAFGDTPGWGESDVDEAVELLERAYQDREAARRIGLCGAATLARLPWSRTAAEMKSAILGIGSP